jgi:hypothetical protein
MMKKSKWPDFLLTVAIRFIGGVVLGCGFGVVCGFRLGIILRSFARNHIHGPFIFVGLCGLVGGIIAICTTPSWQRPWYKGIDHDVTKEIANALAQQRHRPPPPGA